MYKNELETILNEHKIYIESGGIKGRKADLSYTKLIGADLRNVNLSFADLRCANLGHAKLSAANLSDSNLLLANLELADLSSANLSNANMTRTDLTAANLKNANLVNARLIHTTLTGSQMNYANLRNTALNYVNLSYADLRGADLRGTGLFFINFNNCRLSSAQFDMSTAIADSIFANTDLSDIKGLTLIRHLYPSSIGIDTIIKSKGNISKIFLKNAGVPQNIIDYLDSFIANPIDFHSCFISYSSKDEEFAKDYMPVCNKKILDVSLPLKILR